MRYASGSMGSSGVESVDVDVDDWGCDCDCDCD